MKFLWIYTCTYLIISITIKCNADYNSVVKTTTLKPPQISQETTPNKTSPNSILTDIADNLELILAGLRAAAPPPNDCSDLPSSSVSGLYRVRPGLRQPRTAYCDMDTDGGGWTVIQRRDASARPRTNFYQGKYGRAYKWGFGNISQEFWWGLDNVWLLTSQLDRQYELRVDMQDDDSNTRYAKYGSFWISHESDGYKLHVGNFSGNAGDSLQQHHKSRFCMYSCRCYPRVRSGWWYLGNPRHCVEVGLNNIDEYRGQQITTGHVPKYQGIIWDGWKGNTYSLKTADMKIRPRKKSAILNAGLQNHGRENGFY